MKNFTLFLAYFLWSTLSFAQVGIGTTNPEGILDVVSSDSGIIVPRVTDTATVTNPVNGMIVYDISSSCIKFYEDNTWSDCLTGGGNEAVISDCDANGFNGSFINGTPLSGASFSVTITNNTFSSISLTFENSDVTLSGVSGISVSGVSPASATILPGQSEVITYTLSGTPASEGTLQANWSKVSLSCTRTRPVSSGDATFNLPQIKYFPSSNDGAIPTYAVLVQGIITDGETFTVPYTQGTGTFTPYTVTLPNVAQESTVGGTRDLTISYAAGSFAATGTITVTIGVSNGGTTFSIPTVSGSTFNDFAIFDFQVNGVSKGDIIFRACACAARVNATDYKAFLCHNLGADVSLNPHIPQVGLQGAYIHWGRRGPNTTGDSTIDWQTAPNNGPIGFVAAPTATNANVGPIAGWLTASAPNNAWNTGTEANPVKTVNDPCPDGFRVPTNAEWVGVRTNNTATRIGTFTMSNTNYGSALSFGPDSSTQLLTLPAAGYYHYLGHNLFRRGSQGEYWTSRQFTIPGEEPYARRLFFDNFDVLSGYNVRTNAIPVRCIEE